MPKKTLDNWINAWDDSPGSSLQKIYSILRQYVNDSKTGVAGVLRPMTWFAASNGENAQYLSSDPVAYVLKNVTFDGEIKLLLRHLKQGVSNFHNIKFPGTVEIFEGDELLHVLQVIKEKTGVDYFAIDLTQDPEAHTCSQSSSHV